MKTLLIGYIEALLFAANNRNTSQGVKIYELALDQLESADSDKAVLEILSRLKESLIGMDTHGYFPPSEYDLVKKILSLP